MSWHDIYGQIDSKSRVTPIVFPMISSRIFGTSCSFCSFLCIRSSLWMKQRKKTQKRDLMRWQVMESGTYHFLSFFAAQDGSQGIMKKIQLYSFFLYTCRSRVGASNCVETCMTNKNLMKRKYSSAAAAAVMTTTRLLYCIWWLSFLSFQYSLISIFSKKGTKIRWLKKKL